MATYRKFQRGEGDPKEIDKSVKNRWNWSWCDKLLLEGTDGQHLVGDCYRKMFDPGAALCLWCDDVVRYGSAGLNALRQHVKYDKHRKRFQERRGNYRLEFIGNYNSSVSGYIM